MSTYRSAMLSVAALAVKGRRKNTTRRVEIFSGCLFYPCSYVFANKVSD